MDGDSVVSPKAKIKVPIVPPKFLRNLPHLCKTMKRMVETAPNKKRPVDPNTEPDLCSRFPRCIVSPLRPKASPSC